MTPILTWLRSMYLVKIFIEKTYAFDEINSISNSFFTKMELSGSSPEPFNYIYTVYIYIYTVSQKKGNESILGEKYPVQMSKTCRVCAHGNFKRFRF